VDEEMLLDGNVNRLQLRVTR